MKRAVLYFTLRAVAVLASFLLINLQAGCGSVVKGEQSERVMESSLKGTLAISTYLGGASEDSIRDVATDSAGNIFITGGTASSNFPVSSGSFDTSFNGNHDVFVAKLSPSGSLLWATFIGGPNYDRAYALEVDSSGFVYVAGRAGSGFPTTSGVIQPHFGGDVTQNGAYGPQDGFIAKLSPDGSRLIWSTFFGSDGRDFIRDMDVDSSGNVYLGVSDVTRPHPHITPGAFQTVLNGPADGVVAKLSSDGTSLIWSSYFGGGGSDGVAPSVRVGSSGDLYYLTNTNSTDAPVTANAYGSRLAGDWDLILARISSDGSSLVYSTYLGGSASDSTETHGLAVDSSGNAYVAFSTLSPDIATTATAVQRTYGGSGGNGTGRRTNYPGDVYIAKISADGSQLLAGTYLGGRFGEGAEGVAVDSQGNVYVSGATYSNDFPVSSGALQLGLKGKADFFAVKLTNDLGQLIYSTYIGDSGIDYGRTCATDVNGNIIVAGASDSASFPLSNAAQPSYRGGNGDGVIAKIVFADGAPALQPRITAASVSGKKLFVTGENFAVGAELIVNDKKQKKTINDPQSPTTLLIAKKAGKKIAVGDTVRLQVRNPDGSESEVFSFTRPAGDN